MLPVDLITDAEWQAAVNVRNAPEGFTPAGCSHRLAALIALDCITGDLARSREVLDTVDDAYRALAVAAHPAGVDRREPDGQTCPSGGAGTWTDTRAAGASRSIREPGSSLPLSSASVPPAVLTDPDRPHRNGVAGGRVMYVATLTAAAIIVAQLARGGW